MASNFPGFSPKAVRFLKQLEKNNTRDWFTPRKSQFEELLRNPMLELAAIVNDHLRTFAVEHVVDPAKAVHRIYRDVRFSKDKSPYKTNISMMFPRKGLSKNVSAGYYFSLSGHAVEIAGGVYMPGPPDLAVIRNEIASNTAAFHKILLNPKLKKIAGDLRGEQLTRPPKRFDPDHPAIDLIRNKQFYYFTTLPATLATSPGLDKLLIKQFKAMAPAMDYLNRILLKAARAEGGEEELPKRPKPMF